MTDSGPGLMPTASRIVSILPSATEIICRLGFAEALTAISHSCDYPPDVLHLPRVTATRIPYDRSSAEIDAAVRGVLDDSPALYELKIDTLRAARPDLIVSQALCDVCAVSTGTVEAALDQLDPRPRLLNMEPSVFADVMTMVRTLGDALGVSERAETLVQSLEARCEAVRARTADLKGPRPRVLALEWLEPLFNSGHWTPELIQWAGGDPVMAEPGAASRTLEDSALWTADADVILIACCGFGLERTFQDLPRLYSLPGWSDLRAVQNGRVHLIDGQHYFSRPGPRLVESLEIAAHLLHPQLHPVPSVAEGEGWRRNLPSAAELFA